MSRKLRIRWIRVIGAGIALLTLSGLTGAGLAVYFRDYEEVYELQAQLAQAQREIVDLRYALATTRALKTQCSPSTCKHQESLTHLHVLPGGQALGFEHDDQLGLPNFHRISEQTPSKISRSYLYLDCLHIRDLRRCPFCLIKHVEELPRFEREQFINAFTASLQTDNTVPGPNNPDFCEPDPRFFDDH